MALLLVPMASEAEAALGDEWAAIKKTLGNAYKAETTEESLKLLADARGIYMSEFAGAARTHDPATHEVILECYDKAKQNYQDGDNKQAKLWIQCQEKSVYTLGMVMMEVAVANDNAKDYIKWADIVKTKFKVEAKDPASLALLTAIENDSSKLGLYSEVFRDNMLDIFELKTVEELEEALIKYNEDDTYGAKKYAYEGLYYYRTLDPYVVDSIGQGKADQLYGLMEKAMAISDSANDGVSIADLKVQMKDTKKEVEKIVMKHNGIAGTPEALALAGISDRLHLVKVEYVDAIDGTGAIINDMEYAETVAFAHGAVEIADENAEVLKALGASDFEKLQSQLSSIASDVDNFVKISTVLKQADEATLTVKNLQANAGEGGANLGGYFETIDRLLITSQAAYANGDAELAHELVGTAYLDNYEFLEAPIGEYNNFLMKEIENDMREELRNMIESGSSEALIQATIQKITNDLDTAEDLIASGSPAAEEVVKLGEQWAKVKKTLGNAYKAETTDESLALLADAEAIYNKHFASAAQMHDRATHNVIMECYDKAEQNYKDGDNKQAKLWIQCQEKSIYTLGMVMMEDAVSKNNSAAYIDWVDIVKTKFKVADKDAGSLALLTAIENDPSKLKLYSGVVRDNMLDIFELKTVEELEEALIKYNEDDTYGAKKYAYEGLYYYRTLDPYVVDSIGQGKADQLYGLMEKAMAISDSANDGVSIADLKVQMKDTKKEVEKIVMKHNGIAGTPEALALAGISDRLHLVKVEYVDAIDGTGAIINDMEYAETVAFAHGAVEIADENAEVLKALGASDFEKLQSQLSSIASDVDNFVKISTVLKQADEATLTVKNLQANAGEGGANLGGYFETIDRLLITAQAAYANGDADLAHELVGTAYLDNYEFLEAPIGEVDNKLMKTIEDDMRENLRNMITSGSSYNDVESHILMINNDLKTAQAAIASGPAPKAAAAAPAPTPAPTPAPAPAAEETQQISLEEGGGCLIATAAFGSEMAPQVQFLREIRDNTVMNTQSGTAFMTGFNQVYYSFSPAVADLERENPVFKEAVKVTLTPMLTSLTLLNYVEVDTEEEMLGYGISLILLNIGMYFVAPAAAIVAIKKRFF